MTSAELEAQVHDFFRAVGRREVEIYSEFSLQHEFGIFLRTRLGNETVKIQFERPAKFFGVTNRLTKKEIDLACFQSPDTPLAAAHYRTTSGSFDWILGSVEAELHFAACCCAD